MSCPNVSRHVVATLCLLACIGRFMQTAGTSGGCGCTLITPWRLACSKDLLAALPLLFCLHFAFSLRDALDQLMAALAAGDAAAAVALVQQHPKLAWTRHDITEDYPAHVAAAQGQGEVLAALLAAGESADGQVKGLACCWRQWVLIGCSHPSQAHRMCSATYGTLRVMDLCTHQLTPVKVLSSIRVRQLSFCTQQRYALEFGSVHATCIAAPLVVDS